MTNLNMTMFLPTMFRNIKLYANLIQPSGGCPLSLLDTFCQTKGLNPVSHHVSPSSP